MEFALATLIGLVCGAVAMFVIVDAKRRKLDEKEETLKIEKLDAQSTSQRLQAARSELDSRQVALDASIAQFTQASADFSSRAVAYDELWNENAVLKRDLRNLHLHVNKLAFDNDGLSQKQASLDDRINDLGSRYLKENVAWIGSSINASNFALSKKRLLAVVERCRKIDFDVSAALETELIADLKTEFEKAVRAALEREEQARIKAQIREEQRRDRELDREMKQLEREREAIEAALERAMREATDGHSEEVERLKARLAEAEERKQRAISQAQITKSGHVYVISNIGSFGEGVFKIGMTRRLEPMDRVKELGGGLSSISLRCAYDDFFR